MINTYQLIPEEDKGIGWIKRTAFEIIQEAQTAFVKDLENLKKLWDVYNGNFNAKVYDYLTKVEDDLAYPAKVRDMGAELVMSKLQILESEQARRKPRFKASVTDERSLQKKYEQRMKAVLDAIDASLEEQFAIMDSTMQQIQDELGDMEQRLQVQPEDEETAMQLESLRANMPLIRLEYGKMLRTIQRQKVNMEDIANKVRNFKRYSEVEVVENIANAFIKSLLKDANLREDFNAGMREKIVTGQPMYLVDYNEKTGKVDFHVQSAMRGFYSRSSSNRWTDEGDWCCTLEYMSISQIMAEFDLEEDEYKQLNSYVTGDTSALYSYNYNIAVFNPADSEERQHGGIPVWRVWWVSPREWWWKRSPSKYREGAYYNHVITDIRKAKVKKTEEVTRHIVYDRYSAVILGNVICKTKGVDEYVYRSVDRPGVPYLPLVARTYTGASEQPNSLIKRTENLRELYNVIWYCLELNIVLSGVKGMIMDKSQKPEKMSTKKWMYYRRLGTMWIETMKKGRKIPATFNQFQNYDDSLSQSVQLTWELLGGIEAMISRQIGITDPRLGQTVAKDPVHNVMMSQEQSSLITEIQFFDADLVYSRAMSQYLNLVLRYELKNGKVINYLDENQEEILFRMPANTLDKSDFTIHAWNNIQEDHMLDIIRQSAMSQVPIDGIAALMRVDSLAEMENRLAEIVTEQQNRQTQSQMQIDNNKAEQEQRTLQLQAEIEQYAQQMTMQLEQAKMELEKIKLDSELQYKQWEIQFKEKELQAKTDLQLLGVASENQVETAYLQETMRSNRVQEELELNRQRIEALMNISSLEVQKDTANKKAQVDIKKAELSATRRKNNIKD